MGGEPLHPAQEATSGVLRFILGSPVQEKHGYTGASPEKDPKDDRGMSYKQKVRDLRL